MTLDPRTDYNGLSVCTLCGWTIIRETMHDCKAAAGQAATSLAMSLPKIESSKLGYGDAKLTFDFDDKLSLTFRCEDDGSFSIDHLWSIIDLDANAARDLVQTISAWRARRP